MSDDDEKMIIVPMDKPLEQPTLTETPAKYLPKKVLSFNLMLDECNYLIGILGKEKKRVKKRGGEFIAELLLEDLYKAKEMIHG
jgi:hypothetical protein